MAEEKAKIPFLISALPYACFIAGAYMAHRKNSGIAKIFLYGFAGFAIGVLPVIFYMKSNRKRILDNFKKKYETQKPVSEIDTHINNLQYDDKIKKIIDYANKYDMLKDDTKKNAFQAWAKTLGENEINLMVKYTKFVDENQKLDRNDKEKVKAALVKYNIDFSDPRTKYSDEKIMKSEFGYLFGT